MHRPKTARRVVACIALVLGVLLGPAATAAPVGAHAAAATITVIDDHHTRVVLRGVAQRIVALAPNVVEILYALGVGNRVVGVSQDSDYPPAAAHKPVVVTYSAGPNLEQIVGLNPQVIVLGDAAYGVSPTSVRERPGFSAILAVRLNHIYPFKDTL